MTRHVQIAAADVAAQTPMVLYGHPGSGCTQKVLIMLAEKGVEAQMVLIDMSKGEQKGAEHLARHPFGVIPALEIDGFTMYESRAIVRYLNDRLPGASLVPEDRKARAMMEQFLQVEQCYLDKGVSRIFFQKVINPMMGWPVDEAAAEKGRGEIRSAYAVLDRHLAGNDYLAGAAFSVAEISYLPGLFGLKLAREEALIADFPNVFAWVERITARPSWQKVLSMLQW